MGKKKGKLSSFILTRQPVYEKETCMQTSFNPLKKLTLCHILLVAEGLSKYMPYWS